MSSLNSRHEIVAKIFRDRQTVRLSILLVISVILLIVWKFAAPQVFRSFANDRPIHTTAVALYQLQNQKDIVNQDGVLEETDDPKHQYWIGTGGTPDDSWLGLRFSGKVIPPEAVIQQAVIQISVPTTTNIPVSVELAAEGQASPAAYSVKSPPSLRTRLALSRKILVDKWLAGESYHYSIDVTDQYKQLFTLQQQAGMSTGSAFASFVIKGTGAANQKRLLLSNFATPSNLSVKPVLIVRYTLLRADDTDNDTETASMDLNPTTTEKANQPNAVKTPVPITGAIR